MGYDFYFDRVLFPIPPGRLQTRINGQNKTVSLINDGEINILKKAGLTDVSFALQLPNISYPFSRYEDGFKSASYYLDVIENLKTRTDKNGAFLPFQFIVSRVMPNGKILYDTNIKVSLEDYRIRDDADNGFDVLVEVNLKQYRDYGTKIIRVDPPTIEQSAAQAVVEPERAAERAPAQATHTVVRGDTLWAIAKKHLGDGNRWREIYEANNDLIRNPNLIYPGQVFVIP